MSTIISNRIETLMYILEELGKHELGKDNEEASKSGKISNEMKLKFNEYDQAYFDVISAIDESFEIEDEVKEKMRFYANLANSKISNYKKNIGLPDMTDITNHWIQ